MTDAIFKKYIELGGGEHLGDPISLELVTRDGKGRYRDFQRGSIYWTPETGVYLVRGKILEKWREKGAELGFLGYPTSDEMTTPDGRKYNTFQGGSVSYTPQTDSCEVHSGGKSPLHIWRIVGTIVAMGVWLIVAALVAHMSQNGLLAVLTALIGPLTALIITQVWKQPIDDHHS